MGLKFHKVPEQFRYNPATMALPAKPLVFLLLMLLGVQQPIHVDVSLVTVGVRVTDSRGRDVRGLKAEDFSLFEDGVEQDIASFSNETQPITLGVLDAHSSGVGAGGFLPVPYPCQGIFPDRVGPVAYAWEKYMADFYQSGVVTTLHRLKANSIERLELDLERFARTRVTTTIHGRVTRLFAVEKDNKEN